MSLLRLFPLVLLPATFAAACGDDPEGPGGSGGNGGNGGSGGQAAVDACADVDSLRATCEALPERFDTSTTLAKGCYRAAKSPDFGAGVTLTIAAGTTILFTEGTRLEVGEGQSLVASGTAVEPICLTGDVAARGSWGGLLLGRTEGGEHKLDHVTVQYAGSTDSDVEAAAVKVVSDSREVRLSLTDSTIRESEGFGLYLVGSAELTAFSGNTLTKNTLGPASVDSDVAGFLDATSTYSGNDVDEVFVRSNRLSKNLDWAAIDVPFHLSGYLHVDAPWVIEAPNTIILSEGGWISVGGDDAAIDASGTAEAPIVFTGAEAVRGYWDAITFDGTNNAANRLAYVTIEYGGSTASDAYGAGVRAIADSHGVTLSLESTTLRENEGFGLYLAGTAVTPAFTGNTLTGNGLGPASVGARAVHQLDATSTYTDNDVDRLRVRDDRVNAIVSWRDLGVPYELESYLHVDAVWTLEPGVTLMLPEDGWIGVGGDDAALHAVGTAEKPITITGVEQTNGYWHSIIFDTTINAGNSLEHAVIEYGGSMSGAGEAGMITAKSDSHGVVVNVKNSVVRQSAQWGIWLGGYAQYNADIESSNTFEGNSGGDVYIAQ